MKTGHIIMLVGAAAITTGVVLHFRKKKNDEATAASGVRMKRKPTAKAMGGAMQTYTCPATGESITTNSYQEFSEFEANCRREGGNITPRNFNNGTIRPRMIRR